MLPWNQFGEALEDGPSDAVHEVAKEPCDALLRLNWLFLVELWKP